MRTDNPDKLGPYSTSCWIWTKVRAINHSNTVRTVGVTAKPPVQAAYVFLSRVSILTRDIDVANLSVRPSVRCVSVSDKNGFTYRHSFFHHTVAQSF